MNIREPVRRSTLIIDATSKDQIRTDTTISANAICLDLEALVHPGKKEEARVLVKENIDAYTDGAVDILVRINHDTGRIFDDLSVAVWPGLSGILLPGAESEADINQVDEMISNLEKERGMEPGTIGINVIIDTWMGNWNAHKIVLASPRVKSLCVGVADLTCDPSTIQAERYIYLWERSIIIARAAGVEPLGSVGLRLSQAYDDADSWDRASKLGRQLGFTGAMTVHQGAVYAINKRFQ